MVSAKTSPPELELKWLDPNELVLPLDGNIRKDTQLDPDFLASIKSRGVLQPVLVYVNEDGGHSVFDGQRRTLGAVKTAKKTIPALVAPSRADADRVSDQLIVNEQRAQLTNPERVAAFQQLSLFGLTPAQIAKRTSTPAERVGMALTVAGNKVAAKALESYPITLEQAAAIAELSENTVAVHKLTKAAAEAPNTFEHVLADERKRVALERDKDAARQAADAAGLTIIAAQMWAWDYQEKDGPEWFRIDRFALAATPTQFLTLDDVKPFLPDVAAAVGEDYGPGPGYTRVVKVIYFVTNLEAHGIVKLQHSADDHDEPQTEEEIAEAAAREAERTARLKREEDWKQASEIRKSWISEFLERPNPPTDAIIYIAWSITYWQWYEGLEGDVLDWLDIPYDDDDDDRSREDFAQIALAARPKLAMSLVLAIALQQLEDFARPASTDYNQRKYADQLVFHLEQLRNWGYGLSEAETAGLEAAKAAIAARNAPEPEETEGDSDVEAEDED